MLSRLKGIFNKGVFRSLGKSPIVCDLAITLLAIPTFTYLAYCTYTDSSLLRDWHFDRLMKRDAYLESKRLTSYNIITLRSQCSNDFGVLSQLKQVKNNLGKSFCALNELNNKLIQDPKLRKEVINDLFVENTIEVLKSRSKIKAMNSKSLTHEFNAYEESALHLLLILSLSPNAISDKEKNNIEQIMQIVRKDNTPYTLKNAFAEAYFFNKQKTSTGIIYDGSVVCMNPERIEKHETDVLFIHGQQSHCFTSWRVLEPNNKPLRLTSGRTYIISTLWPTKFLSDKYASRLLTINYTVVYIVIHRQHKVVQVVQQLGCKMLQ